ncbi:carboxypeptidase-like regulatory domain-containing protein, partial [Methanobrevibacter arboriphilus]|uniref:carboxypeptidase-like regulatory domain-containing protein n=1 Tax=Methanobrevibacter arboriphilus TaxID=39441 RepID=UPI001CDADC1D
MVIVITLILQILVAFFARNVTNSSVIVVPSPASVGNMVNISGVVSDEADNPLVGVSVTIVLSSGGSNTSYNRVTDTNGLWVLEYVVPDNVTPGTDITVIMNWNGNESYYGFNNSTSFRILINTNSTIIIPTGPVTVGSVFTI